MPPETIGPLIDYTTMQRILVLNSKGGSGKSTIATNLAGYYAHKGYITALLDYDPQGSSTRWLSERPKTSPDIHGIIAFKKRSDVTRSFQLRMPAQAEKVIIDAPAGVSGFHLNDYVQRVDSILIPVLPSPIDIHATAHYIEDLILVGKARSRGVHLAVIANRVKENTQVYKKLRSFLTSLNLPFIATLRDCQDYIRASESGLSIHELDTPTIQKTCEQWIPLLAWLESLPNVARKPQPVANIFPALGQN